MPIHDFLCLDCGSEQHNLYIPLDQIDIMVIDCEKCGTSMDFDLRNKRNRNTRSPNFPEFTLHHTKRLDGSPEGREIHSLADIRRFEKEHADSGVCVEAFSYDSQQHIPEPQAQAEPKRMTDQQKRDFVEKFRALDIKDERSARDY